MTASYAFNHCLFSFAQMDFELSCEVAAEVIQLLLSEVDRSLAEKQLLTHLNDYNRHQSLKLIM